jgi:effector-binding domain-containing protein
VIAEKHTEVRERVAELLALDARLDETSAPRQAHVEVRTVKGDLVISQRFTGAYGDVGAAFGRLGKAAGGLFTGPPYTLYWQEEYLPDGADMETCIPVARVIDSPGITCRVVLAVRAVTSVHAGSFETISAAYERVFEYAVAHDLAPTISVRERYLEGPGDRSAMSPEEYLTEIAVLVTSAENRAP